MMRLCCVIWLLSSTIGLHSQIEVLAALDKDSIVIGDYVTMQVTVNADPGVEVLGAYGYFLDSVYSSLQTINAVSDAGGDTIPAIADFVLVDKAGWNDEDGDGIYNSEESAWTTKQVGSNTLYEQQFKYRLWDPGSNVFLTPAIAYRYNGEVDVWSNEAQMIAFVIPPKGTSTETDSLKIAPIKNIISEPTNLSDYMIYFILLGVVLIGGLVYWLVTKYRTRKRDVVYEDNVEEQIILPPHVVALEKLAHLGDEKLWQRGEVKRYQSELTYIIREYLEGRYSIAALESTTSEIISQLKTTLTDPTHQSSLQRILQVADLVKFAKAKPEEGLHASFLNEAEGFVHATKMDESAITHAQSDEEE